VSHVAARRNESRKIFRDDEDRRRFLATLAEAVQEYGLRLRSYSERIGVGRFGFAFTFAEKAGLTSLGGSATARAVPSLKSSNAWSTSLGPSAQSACDFPPWKRSMQTVCQVSGVDPALLQSRLRTLIPAITVYLVAKPTRMIFRMKRVLSVLTAIAVLNGVCTGAEVSRAKITSPWLPLSGTRLTFILPKGFLFEELDGPENWKFTEYDFKAKRGDVAIDGEILQYHIGRAWTHGYLEGNSVRLPNGFRGVYGVVEYSDPDEWRAALCVKTIQNRCIIVEVFVPGAWATPKLKREVSAALRSVHFYRHPRP
jgi:hypothetical protein